MVDILLRVWENLIARTEGPLNLRFLIQPSVSLLFAIRAGLRDAKQGTVPFLWRFVTSKGKRSAVARESWGDVGKIFLMGIAFDVIYQLVVIFKAKSQTYFYPLESGIVATALAIVPYWIMRGPVSRLLSYFYKPGDSNELKDK
jgi:hypothetical protein